MNHPVIPSEFANAVPVDAIPDPDAIRRRDAALLRFAIAITVLNILGHLWFGFEASWITPFVALACTYTTELVGEWARAQGEGRIPRYRGGLKAAAKFLLSAHITGLAVGMLLFAAEQLWVIAFAAVTAVASKYVVTVASGGGRRTHFLNPSNFGIAATLALFPNVGIAPPYQFGENLVGALDWLFPLLICTTGSLINLKLTKRMPLILGWLGAFALQAIARSIINDTPLLAGLAPMTGFAFVLFTFYMVSDPATTPNDPKRQMLFGAGVALAYAILMELHIVFGLFFALVAVCCVRGLALAIQNWSGSVPGLRFRPEARAA